ncbi:MAG: hypothetical protein V3V02_07595 [Rhizobiaceae bacterium]
METLGGVVDVMVGRASGLSRIDLTNGGFWISFLGLALAGLVDASAYSITYAAHQFISQPTKLWFVFASLLIALIGYGASILALYLLCRAPNEQANFIAAIITNNWASAVVSVITFPLVILSTLIGSSEQFWGMVSVVLLGVMIAAGTNILRFSLQIPIGRALIYFAVTTMISIICVQGLTQLAGFASPA